MKVLVGLAPVLVLKVIVPVGPLVVTGTVLLPLVNEAVPVDEDLLEVRLPLAALEEDSDAVFDAVLLLV